MTIYVISVFLYSFITCVAILYFSYTIRTVYSTAIQGNLHYLCHSYRVTDEIRLKSLWHITDVTSLCVRFMTCPGRHLCC